MCFCYAESFQAQLLDINTNRASRPSFPAETAPPVYVMTSHLPLQPISTTSMWKDITINLLFKWEQYKCKYMIHSLDGINVAWIYDSSQYRTISCTARDRDSEHLLVRVVHIAFVLCYLDVAPHRFERLISLFGRVPPFLLLIVDILRWGHLVLLPRFLLLLLLFLRYTVFLWHRCPGGWWWERRRVHGECRDGALVVAVGIARGIWLSLWCGGVALFPLLAFLGVIPVASTSECSQCVVP